MLTRPVLASVLAVIGQSVTAGQFIGSTPIVAQRPSPTITGNVGTAMTAIPPFVFGSMFRPGFGFGLGSRFGFGAFGNNLTGFPNTTFNSGVYNNNNGLYGNGYNSSTPFGYGGYGYGYYPNPYVYPQPAPPGTYENPNPVKPVAAADLPPTLVAPETPKTDEWADARTSFASASSRVSAARRAVEELRARLEAMSQSPRANLETNMATAEAILRSAQDAMAAGNLERSRTEIRRASDMAGVVLKEFGR